MPDSITVRAEEHTNTHHGRRSQAVNLETDYSGAHDHGQLSKLGETWKWSAPCRDAPAWCGHSPDETTGATASGYRDCRGCSTLGFAVGAVAAPERCFARSLPGPQSYVGRQLALSSEGFRFSRSAFAEPKLVLPEGAPHKPSGTTGLAAATAPIRP